MNYLYNHPHSDASLACDVYTPSSVFMDSRQERKSVVCTTVCLRPSTVDNLLPSSLHSQSTTSGRTIAVTREGGPLTLRPNDCVIFTRIIIVVFHVLHHNVKYIEKVLRHLVSSAAWFYAVSWVPSTLQGSILPK